MNIRQLTLLLAVLLAAAAVICGCGPSVPEPGSSLPASSAGEPSAVRSDVPSEPGPSDTSEDSGEAPLPDRSAYRAGPAVSLAPDTANLKGIKILGCSRTSQDGKSVVVGTCDEGVTVKAETKYGEAEAVSWYGMFSVPVECPGASVIVTLSEWYEGERIGTPTASECKPVKPGSDMWGILAGKNSQLFLEKAGPEFTGRTKLNDKAVENFQKKIAARVEQAKNVGDGCELIFIIIPSAMTAYPEDAPDGYQAASVTRYTQMMDAINEAGATAIDLRPLFREARNDELPVYYKTDSHWAEYGAYLAYVLLFEKVAERFPAAKPRTFDEFDWTASDYQSGDGIYYLAMSNSAVREHAWLRTPAFDLPKEIARFRRYENGDTLAYGGFTNTAINGTTLKTGNGDLPDMIIFRDSYAAQLMDIVAERCNTSWWPAMWSYTWNIAQIRKDKPDYVVYLISEWNAGSLLN